MKHELYKDYALGMDIACLGSRYNLTCEEVRELLGIEEDEEKLMSREEFFEWLNKYKGEYKFIEDEYERIVIEFYPKENEDGKTNRT